MKIDPNFTPSYDEVCARAFTIWEQRGRPAGEDRAHWLLAEEQLRNEHQEITTVISALSDAQKGPTASEEMIPATKTLGDSLGKPTPSKSSRKRKAS